MAPALSSDIPMSRKTKLYALSMAVIVGLLAASETGALALGLMWPLEALLGLPEAVRPLEYLACGLLALYLGLRLARNAYAAELELGTTPPDDDAETETDSSSAPHA